MHRLFVDVGYELSEHQLRQHFAKHGTVSDVYLPKHSMGRNKGYAFVTFTSEQALSQALLDTQPVVHGVKLKVKRATPRPPGKIEPAVPQYSTIVGPTVSDAKVLVEGLGPNISESQVQQHFALWGPVLQVSLFPTQHSKDCVVTFDSPIAAKRACNQSDRAICGWPVKSISLVSHRDPDQQQPRTASHSSESSEVVSDRPRQVSNQNGLVGAAAVPDLAGELGIGSMTDAAQMAYQLRAANPSAFATWLHLEQMQQQLLAEHFPGDSAPSNSPLLAPRKSVHPVQTLPHSFGPPAPDTPPYSAPYLQTGFPLAADCPQQHLASMLTKLYSHSHPSPADIYRHPQQLTTGLDSMYGESGCPTLPHDHPYLSALQPKDSMYGQVAQSPLPLDSTCFSGVSGGGLPMLSQSHSSNAGHLRTLAQQAVAAAGASGFNGHMNNAQCAESEAPKVTSQDQVGPSFGLPSWSPFGQ